MKKLYICDFDDSFTYNIFSLLFRFLSADDIEVVSKENIEEVLNLVIKNNTSRIGLVLGPGPGKPEDYSNIYPKLKSILSKQNIFIMGICLGHQLVWKSLGLNIVSAKSIKHGESESFTLPFDIMNEFELDKTITVQRYNSLVPKVSKNQIKMFNQNGWCLFSINSELIMSKFNNVVTYQFHPESIGTINNTQYFKSLIEFITK